MNMILEITLRLFVALLLGGVIGIEREYRSKEAGFRTHLVPSFVLCHNMGLVLI